MRKYNESNGLTHKPLYFEEVQNPLDEKQPTMWRYNQTYFEKDRKEQSWERSLDLYSETLPENVQQFLDAGKK
jgi:hypothetical protein